MKMFFDWFGAKISLQVIAEKCNSPCGHYSGMNGKISCMNEIMKAKLA
jgi:hypothetical protein